MRTGVLAACLLAAGCATVEPAASVPPTGPWRLAISPASDPGGQPGLIWLREADLGPAGATTNRHWEMSLRGEAGDEAFYRMEYDCRSARYRQLEMVRFENGAPTERAGPEDWSDIVPHTPPRAIMPAACGETRLETGASDAPAARVAEAALRARWAASRGR
jgi:hypothetical protein